MSRELQGLLQKLKNRGNTALEEEVAAFLEATTEATNPCTSTPYACRLLAQAAKTLRDNGDVSIAHDLLGASVEVFLEESSGADPKLSTAITANLCSEKASEHAFKDVTAGVLEDAEFNSASSNLVSCLSNLLLNAGYINEARKYLMEYNVKQDERDTIVANSTKQMLKDLQSKYRSGGDLVRARALEEVISDLNDEEDFELDADIEEEEENETSPEPKLVNEEGDNTIIEDESLRDEDDEDMVMHDSPESEKPVLEVDPPSEQEVEEKEAAQASLTCGNLAQAKSHLKKAAKLERIRLTAALIRKGDFELALAGLDDSISDDVPAEEKAGGYASKQDCNKDEDCDATGGDLHITHKDDEKPTEEEMDKRIADAECDEKDIANAISAHVRKYVRNGKITAAKSALKDLSDLEKEIVANISIAENKLKDMALAKEGYEVWKEVRAMNLKATRVVADAEGKEEEVERASKGLEELKKLDNEDQERDDAGQPQDQQSSDEELSDSLDSDAEESSDVITEDNLDSSKEAEAMKYECLQDLKEIKDMDVDRNALAFTFWDGSDPYWTIQAAGKPIAEVHLADQSDSADIAAFFCDQAKWPNVIAQTTEKVGLYNMLKGVNARFYAHGVTKSSLAKQIREEVEASMKGLRQERLTALRRDFVDTMTCAAEALNKGLIPGKSNPLKRTFVDKLTSLGFANPALAVEECFATGFKPFLDQVIADANEYLEMPKEAFVHTKKMIFAANNVAVAQAGQFSDETLSSRLSRRSMPLTHMAEESYAAPTEVDAALRQMSSSERQSDMRKRLRLGLKY